METPCYLSEVAGHWAINPEERNIFTPSSECIVTDQSVKRLKNWVDSKK
jgi:hypothetical protein